MADPGARMERRLLWASLWRQRGPVSLAVLAVAIGASVAAALLHVSGDVNQRLTRELRALGPNLLLLPGAGAPADWLDERALRERLAATGLDGVPLLYASARAGDAAVPIVGADLPAARRLHPSWRRTGPCDGAIAGVRLARRLGLAPGDSLTLAFAGGPRTRAVLVTGTFEAGGPDDDALWLPLSDVQALANLPGRASLAQVRVEGGEDALPVALRRLERGGAFRARPLYALSRTEQDLLHRMRRVMAMVTVAALVAGALSAYGTLTDLALERRREIALLKAIGASRRRIIGRLVTESLVIGLAGGVLGWLIGFGFAQIIGREVFHAGVRLRWDVPPIVIALATLTAAVAALGPVRLALAVEPARALKGE